jgi:polyisoprenoid-binding protein YceI
MTTVAPHPGALTLATNWHIDPAHSTAAFAVRHLMISTVRGRFRELTGTVALSKDDPTWAGVQVTIPVASIDNWPAAARCPPPLTGLLRCGAIPDDHLQRAAPRR